MSVHQNICTNLDTALKAISIANGYTFDINGKVYEWKATDVQLADVPCAIWRDHIIDWDEDDQQTKKLGFEIVFVASGNTSPALVRNMLGDGLKAFFTLENRAVFSPSYISGCYLINATIATEQGDKKTTAVKINCFVEYITELTIT
jgi:hypothetical protein